ncbi:MAG: SAM-dependent chlorinase/fluorinase [bacterium]
MKSRRDAGTRRRGDKTIRPVAASSRLHASPITLLTDFGNADYFAGAMKGVILSVNPNAQVVDIAHDIAPQDIEAAAFNLLAAHTSFPAGTIHVAVVDPGVGSNRRAILVEAGEQFFVGPDNGIFSYVCDSAKGDEPSLTVGLRPRAPRVFHLNNPKYFRHPVSDTFNGRDIFAPVAAALSIGVEPKELGVQIDDYARLPPLKAEISRDGVISGRVIHIDHFGNCVTNITAEELTSQMIADGVRVGVCGQQTETFHRFFAAERDNNKLFCVWGSAGFLEIAAKNQSAAKLLQAKRGDSVVITRT